MKLTNKHKTITKAQTSEAVKFEPLVTWLGVGEPR